MGNNQSIQKINYEDIQYVIKNPEMYLLINTLKESEQHCIITNTKNMNQEVELLNNFLKNGNKNIPIIVYGKNGNDESIYTKYNQLRSLGFYNTYIYTGGLFEWLMLQDIYGENEFPTNKKEIDILKYKPNKILNIQLLHDR